MCLDYLLFHAIPYDLLISHQCEGSICSLGRVYKAGGFAEDRRVPASSNLEHSRSTANI